MVSSLIEPACLGILHQSPRLTGLEVATLGLPDTTRQPTAFKQPWNGFSLKALGLWAEKINLGNERGIRNGKGSEGLPSLVPERTGGHLDHEEDKQPIPRARDGLHLGSDACDVQLRRIGPRDW